MIRLSSVWITDKSSRSQMFSKIGVLKKIAIFTRKQLCWSLFLIKFQTLMDWFLYDKDFRHETFKGLNGTMQNTCFQ